MEGPCTFCQALGPLNFMNSGEDKVGLSEEGSKEAEVVCERQAALTSPGWSGAEPPQAGM